MRPRIVVVPLSEQRWARIERETLARVDVESRRVHASAQVPDRRVPFLWMVISAFVGLRAKERRGRP
jgi:hypothetical protein